MNQSPDTVKAGSKEHRTFMQPAVENPLKKREEFATSLRKKKRSDKIAAKRRKLTLSQQKIAQALAAQKSEAENGGNIHLLTDRELRQSDYYQGFPEFEKNKNLYEQVLMQTAPNEKNFSEQCEKIQYLLECLMEGQDLRHDQQLVLLTCVRKEIATQEEPDVDGIINNTQILQIITTVFTFQPEADQEQNVDDYQMVNFMKLEALWILTNLFYGKSEEIDVILGTAPLKGIALKTDFIVQEYLVLDQINEMLAEQVLSLTNPTKSYLFDMRIISQIYFALGNFSSEDEFVTLMLQKVNILDSIEVVLTKSEVFPTELMENISLILNNICQLNYETEVTSQLIRLLKLLIPFVNVAVQCNCYSAFTALIGNKQELSLQITNESKIIPYAVQSLGSHTESVYKTANEMLGHIFMGTDKSALSRAILEGYLTKVQGLLNQTNNKITKEALWSLSNLVAEEPNFAQAFFKEQNLVERIIILMRNPNPVLRTEAVWVITNAITAADQKTNRDMMTRDGEDLLKAFCDNFHDRKASEDIKFLYNLFEATDKLLQLDHLFKVQATHLVAFQGSLCELQDYIYAFTTHKNVDIQRWAQNVLKYFPETEEGELEFYDEQPMQSSNEMNFQI